MADRNGFVLSLAVAAGNRHDLPPAREALARLRVPADAAPGCVFAGDGAFDDRGFRAESAALGFRPDSAPNPRSTGRPGRRGPVPGRRVVERAHAHLRCAFRGVRTRWGRLARSFDAFLATAAAHRIIARAGL